MKSLLIFLVGVSASLSVKAQPTFDRQYAYESLLEMGYEVAYEEVGEVHHTSPPNQMGDRTFVLANEVICQALGAAAWSFNDDLGQADCLMWITQDGEIAVYDPGITSSYFE